MAAVRIQDIVNPDTFAGYVRQRTEEKWNLLAAGVVGRDPFLDALLSGAAQMNGGGGVTFQIPSWQPLDGDDEENVSTDVQADILRLLGSVAGDPALILSAEPAGNSLGKVIASIAAAAGVRGDSVPSGLESSLETAVRLSRNKSWSAMDLSSRLAGDDPLSAIIELASDYWNIRLQKAGIATMQGIFADNAASPTGTDTHTQNDLTLDISGSAFDPGVTNFTAEAAIDALSLLGDSRQDIVAMQVHSTVKSTMEKNDLIDYVPDSESSAEIPTFRGLRVIEDDGMPNPAGPSSIGANTAAGIYHTWFLGANALRYGAGSPMVPTAVHREELAGKGGGQEILTNRVEWMIHPTGHAFQGTPALGGPANSTLATAGTWSRVFPQRKQIKICRMITREA